MTITLYTINMIDFPARFVQDFIKCDLNDFVLECMQVDLSASLFTSVLSPLFALLLTINMLDHTRKITTDESLLFSRYTIECATNLKEKHIFAVKFESGLLH